MHQRHSGDRPSHEGRTDELTSAKEDERSPHVQASQHQETAELWQALAQQQQTVASLLQRAAVHQRELIVQSEAVGDNSMEDQFRQFEDHLLKLLDSAFALEGLALEQVKRAIKKTEEALHM